jgi:hypothetical protein
MLAEELAVDLLPGDVLDSPQPRLKRRLGTDSVDEIGGIRSSEL